MMTACPVCAAGRQHVIRPPRSALIIQGVARAARVDLNVLLGGRRLPRVVRARHAAAWLLRQRLKLSTTRVGQLLRRDHSTIVYALRKVERDNDLQAWADSLVPREATRC